LTNTDKFGHGVTFAVVVGGDLNGLGVVRSLARERVPTIILDPDPRKPTMRTRFGRKVCVRAVSGDVLIDELLTLRNRLLMKPVLFLTQEASVATISDAYAAVSDKYFIAMPESGVMKTLMNKSLFQARAQQLGFAVPRGLTLTARTTPLQLDSLRFPCVLKPTTKDDSYAKRFAKAYRITKASDAHSLWQTMQEVIDEAILQEWIEGGDSDVFFCLQYRSRDGGAVASFVGRKTCQWPPSIGGTATCISAPDVADELSATTDRFFTAVGFIGLGSMEYKRDVRDGKFYMVEPTVGRTDYQEEVAVLNGVNIPFAAYADELGLSTEKIYERRPKCGWRDSLGYYNALATGASDPAESLAPGARIFDAYFRVSDPGPYLALKAQSLFQRINRILGKSSNA
jgi:D-aspartate ligase